MSGHGRPPLCKPEHVSRARELCGRGAINPDLLEPGSWARQQNDRRKGRKGRKPRILRKQGPFRGRREPAETRRKLAETPSPERGPPGPLIAGSAPLRGASSWITQAMSATGVARSQQRS